MFLLFIIILLFVEYHREKEVLANIQNELCAVYPHLANIRILPSIKSYCKNKQVIYISPFNSRDKIKEIILHEYAHVLTPEYDDHGTSFHATLNSLKLKSNLII